MLIAHIWEYAPAKKEYKGYENKKKPKRMTPEMKLRQDNIRGTAHCFVGDIVQGPTKSDKKKYKNTVPFVTHCFDLMEEMGLFDGTFLSI